MFSVFFFVCKLIYFHRSKKWADDSDEEDETPTETFEDGIKTLTEYKTNDKGQKVKVNVASRHFQIKLVMRTNNNTIAGY